MKLNKTAEVVLKKRYSLKDDKSEVIKTYEKCTGELQERLQRLKISITSLDVGHHVLENIGL